jgi:hypothetical protein
VFDRTPKVDKKGMSTTHYWLYGTLGIVLVALGLWRIGGGRASGPLKPAGLIIGGMILTVLMLSLVGIVSLDGVEACLQETRSSRSKLLVCLVHVRMASKEKSLEPVSKSTNHEDH